MLLAPKNPRYEYIPQEDKFNRPRPLSLLSSPRNDILRFAASLRCTTRRDASVRQVVSQGWTTRLRCLIEQFKV